MVGSLRIKFSIQRIITGMEPVHQDLATRLNGKEISCATLIGLNGRSLVTRKYNGKVVVMGCGLHSRVRTHRTHT